MNYRLNIMGFISHPALDTESDAHTNYGIMDMQAALSWVQRNIRQFGGDPDNVTIFGESAGGTAVYFNMISPASKGLFHRAIAHSPAYAANQATYAAGVVRGQEFAAAVGCGSDASPATAACLRAVPIQTIIASGFPGRGPVRALDGKILTINMGEAFATGNFNKVPVISGNNRDEQTWFLGMTELNSGTVLTAANYPAAVTTAFGAVVGPQVLTQYPLSNYPNPSNALAAAQTDRGFACGTRRANRLLAQHVPTYGYLFADRTAPFYFPAVSFNYWAAHTLELEYIFANFKGATGDVQAAQPGAEQALRRHGQLLDYLRADGQSELQGYARLGPLQARQGQLPAARPAQAERDAAVLDHPQVRLLDLDRRPLRVVLSA